MVTVGEVQHMVGYVLDRVLDVIGPHHVRAVFEPRYASGDSCSLEQRTILCYLKFFTNVFTGAADECR